eukprot:2209647-Alexandrium_andersonii.AAC.1
MREEAGTGGGGNEYWGVLRAKTRAPEVRRTMLRNKWLPGVLYATFLVPNSKTLALVLAKEGR